MIPPPVIGTFIGMALSTIPFISPLFITTTPTPIRDGNSSSKKPLLGVVFDTAQNFGKAASPLSLLVLVSSLAVGAGFGSSGGGGGDSQQQKLLSSKSSSKSSPESSSIIEIPFWKRWAIVSFVRFIISPLVMYGLLTFISSPMIGLIDSPFSSLSSTSSSSSSSSSYTSMLWFICILESCMPPAQNQVTLLHVANKTKKANEMATFLFSIYATSIIPLVVLISFALQKFELI